MLDRLSRSWKLLVASASVLSKDRELLLFPLISSGALLVVTLAFALPMFGLGALDGLTRGGNHAISAGVYVVAFLFYFCQYFVIFFFNAGLVGAALMRLEGGDPTFSDGLRLASSKMGAIAGYALIAATVGVVLRIIQERVGLIGRIVVGLIGIGWNLATYLVVPVLVSRDVGPVDAIKESASILKETWGENVVGQIGLGAAFGFIFVLVFIAGAFMIIVAAMAQSAFLIAFAITLTIGAIAVTALVQAALGGIYSAALYRYATTGKETEGFDAGAMKLAFAPK
jgi:hypothetical protein